MNNKKILLFLIIFVLITCLFLFIFYKINNSNNSTINKNENFENENKKIAFLFLIYDDIWNEEMWYNFFKNADPNKYSIYIHYKINKPLKYFNDKKINNCIETKWGDISLSYAHLKLFENAIKDPENYKFINLSHACIPFRSFDYVYDYLTKDNNSYFNISTENIFPRCESLLKFYNNDKSKIHKSSEWFILNREHVQIVLDEIEILKEYKNISCPEEHYFITTIKNKNDSNLILTNDENINATTFTNWNDMKYPFPGGSPMNYDNISEEELKYIFTGTCLFGRKFKGNCTVNNKETLNDYSIQNKWFN